MTIQLQLTVEEEPIANLAAAHFAPTKQETQAFSNLTRQQVCEAECWLVIVETFYLAPIVH